MKKQKPEKKGEKAKEKKTLVLLDSHAILHRAYHALPDFASKKGEPTGALYGLSTMLIRIIGDLKPDYIVAAFDLPKPTYRHEAYKDYKAGRKKTDENLISQINRSKDLFAAFSIPVVAKEGFEADDMLGTITEEMKSRKDIDIIIASGDMDTLQLVDGDKVQVFTLKKGINDTVIYDEDAVKARFGFPPELLPDYKGLRGDPSDNIIGIKGIGEKTATILITTFGTIENMYKVLKKNKKKFEEIGLTPRIIKLLEEGEEEALFSKMLATIRRDAPINFKLPEKEWCDSCALPDVLKLFGDLEFRSLGQRVKALLAPTNGTLGEGAWGGDGGADGTGGDDGFGPGVPRVAEEIDQDEMVKVQLAVWILDSNISNPTLDDILQFANKDTFAEAKEYVFAELKKQNLLRIYDDIELPLIPLLHTMHVWGIKVDVKYLAMLSKEYHKELEKLEKSIWKHAGEEFNINSPKQLGDILFEKMGLKAGRQKKTAGGARSTRESELEKLKDLHPIVNDILEYRQLQKLVSTYIDTIPALVAEDGRLHTTFIQAGAATGRMASINPNLQNIPIKSEKGRAIRNAFIAEKGFKLAAFDYSQIELRIAAFLSKDEKLIDIFKSGRDVHTEVAARVFKVKPENVDKEMRRKAKVINFGILYGMGVNALRENLGTDRAEAQAFYNEYFATFSTLAQYLDHVKAEAARRGYTETFFGRRRYFEGINSKLPFIKAMAERMAINAPIQGTEADILKIAMLRIDEYTKKAGLEKLARPLLQVHDELIYEVSESKLKEFSKKVQEIMREVMLLKDTEGVPLEVGCEVGDSWGSMEEQK